MKWEGRRQSTNVEDRRGMGKGTKAIAGGGIIGIIVLLISIFGGETGQQIAPVLQELQNTQVEQSAERTLTPEEVETGQFVATVFGDTEDVWHKIFRENGSTYIEPKMILFTGQVATACGNASSAAGPFYCPADQKVYMDLDFFNELKSRFGAQGGDFAIAYVIAHEVGHHVQTILGTSAQVRQQQQQMNQTAANQLTVRQELQADFYAGVWAHHNQQYLEEGDIEEALSAAHAVGDDAIQKRVQGHVVPDAFTHGTSEQRKRWFMLGYKTGDITRGNTFSVRYENL